MVQWFETWSAFPVGDWDYFNTPHWGAIWCLCNQAFPGVTALGPRLFPKGNPKVNWEPFLWYRLCSIIPKPVCTSWKIRLFVLWGGSPSLSDSPQSTFPVALGTEQPMELTGNNSGNATLWVWVVCTGYTRYHCIPPLSRDNSNPSLPESVLLPFLGGDCERRLGAWGGGAKRSRNLQARPLSGSKN